MKNYFLLIVLLLSVKLAANTRILAISGSTREASLNKHLLCEAIEHLKKHDNISITVFDLKKNMIPFYDGDLEEKFGMPEQAKWLRALMINSDLVLISSPEYNGSVSAQLKNAIDWASRSEKGGPSQEAFKHARFLLLSASPGLGGGARGLEHLRAILKNVGADVLPYQITVPRAHEQLGKKEAEYKQKLLHVLDVQITQNN